MTLVLVAQFFTRFLQGGEGERAKWKVHHHGSHTILLENHHTHKYLRINHGEPDVAGG